MAALRYEVRSLIDMARLARTFDAFPEPFLQHVPMEVVLLACDSVSGARLMETILVARMDRYPWTAPRRAELRNLAHLSEMVACVDDHLETFAEHVEEGEPLGVAEREDLFGPLEAMAYAGAGPMVSGPATTLARRIAFLAKNARRYVLQFPPHRVLGRVHDHRTAIAHITNLAPPMV